MDGLIVIDSGALSGIVTAVLIVAFVAVAIWAYSAKRKASFDAAARMPLEDDPKETARTREKKQ